MDIGYRHILNRFGRVQHHQDHQAKDGDNSYEQIGSVFFSRSRIHSFNLLPAEIKDLIIDCL
jgi:hypothetical protein